MQHLTKHLKEAIELNTERMPLYAKLSSNQTLPFSKKLIRYEKLSLQGAWFFDRVGYKLQQQGVPYLKAEFVEMSEVPAFAEKYPSHINYKKPINKIDVRVWQQTLNYQLRQKDFKVLVNTCLQFLEELARQPHVYCMLRHIVESLGRMAYLLPWHEEQCARKHIQSPTRYSLILMKLHILSLKKTAQFDEAIAPIQNNDLPFIYQDLPPIKVKPNLEEFS